MKQKLFVFVSVLVLLAMFAACGTAEPESTAVPTAAPTAEPTPEPTPAPTAEPTPEPTPEALKTPEDRNPLTGLEIDPDYLDRRPVAIMINNHINAQPQHGLNEADQIYEMVTEGGITRLLAVYQDVSSLPAIGSIRSARYYYADIAAGLEAVYIHCGHANINSYMNAYISSRMDATYSSAWNYRDSERMATMDYEHTLMTSGSLLEDYILNSASFDAYHSQDYENSMNFIEDYELDGVSASAVEVDFGSKITTFEYDPDTDEYLVYEKGGVVSYEGSYQYDGNDWEILDVTNVVVCKTNVGALRDSNYFDYVGWGGSASDDRLDYCAAVDVVGSGEGWYFSGGEMVPVTWTKDSQTDGLSFTDAEGNEQLFRAGSTYFCFIGYNDGCFYEE